MKLGTPRWWYVKSGGPAPLTRALLTPLSWIWADVTRRRIARTTPSIVGAPVICVGNVTMGGAGKTPIVRELLLTLTQRGVNAHGLSRGYGGRLKGPVRVDATRHTAKDVGDEPLMLAQDFPMWVSADRVAGAKAAARWGAQAIVMDDGHQNPTIRKALSLVVVDGETRDGEWPFGDGRVFPAGPMREPLKVGLSRADAVIVLLPVDVEQPDFDLLVEFGDMPVLVARLEAAAPVPKGPQVGFAGVGKPWKVEKALTAAGCQVVDFAPFPDHGEYDEATLLMLADRAKVYDAGLVTTEKDWMRLPPAWRDKVTPWPVRARFDDPAALAELLASVGV
ncbi:tetraacyldisaccharide 4'-kinase [Caulobacter sp. CCH9-E1]|uniref:tetraacyldisaccharide 4'-kinase n=1 Tax=Caulobacter sp. CCH9-E1 TaxID=1768768 RepID=UPI000834FE4F|nr:tetraacyldisaccharide 4'-kinase [Caulobacter sp. CCH9-E1]